MNKKIVGIFVCTLMVLTAFSAVATTTKQEKSSLVLSIVTPNDPGFSNQYYLQTTHRLMWASFRLFPPKLPFLVKPDADIDAPEAWAIETGSPDVVIAIIDTGIDYTHPDLKANIWNNTDEIPSNGIDDDLNGYIDDVVGWNFAKNTNDPKDDAGHGTLCAGIAAAVGNNSVGISGVAWHCKIMPLKIINETGWFTWEDLATAISYAANNGADIISISLGDLSVPPTIVENAVNYAYEKGVFICAAAGNNGKNTLFYPAAYEKVTAVGMTNPRDRAQFMSNYGEWVDIAAPGMWIYSTMPTYYVSMNVNGFENYSWGGGGTSFAAPQVAGAAALLKSKDPSLTPAEIKTLICNNNDLYTGNHYIGTGRLNVYKALSALTR